MLSINVKLYQILVTDKSPSEFRRGFVLFDSRWFTLIFTDDYSEKYF